MADDAYPPLLIVPDTSDSSTSDWLTETTTYSYLKEQLIMPAYTQGHSSAMLNAHQCRSASDSCGYFTPLLASRPTARILDVGCGPGSITASLASLVPNGEVIGIDYSADAIQRASTQSSIPENCTFQVASLDDHLPFPDNSFDVVHTHQVLIHLSDPVKALVEMRRVCRPRGFVASREGDWGAFVVFPETATLRRHMDLHGSIIRASGAEPNAGRHLRYWALQAGFKDERITFSSSPILYSGAEVTRWWGAVQAERFGGGTFKENVVTKGLAADEEVASFGQAWLEWGEQPGAVYSAGCGEVVCWKD